MTLGIVLIVLIEIKAVLVFGNSPNNNVTLITIRSNESSSSFQPKTIGGFPICLTDLEATYCDLDRSYPQIVIGNALRKSPFYNEPAMYLNHRFNGEENRVINVTEQDNMELIISTMTENVLKSTCPHWEFTIYPPVAKSSKTSSWVYVINQPEYKQGVKGEKCDKDTSYDCNDTEPKPTSYRSSCVQRFKTTKLLAIDPTNVTPFEDSFDMPSHCECHIHSQLFVERMRPHANKNDFINRHLKFFATS